MAQAFIDRNPTEQETLLLRLLLSCFRDGTGGSREKDGSTRPDWRQIERCFAEFFQVSTNENKNIFDLLATDIDHPSTFYGLSVKSKELSKKRFLGLNSDERVYMEIANSPAKFFDALKDQHDIEEKDFKDKKFATEIGSCLIATVKSWHSDGKTDFEKNMKGRTLDINKSKYLCLSYSTKPKGEERTYIVHAFSLEYPNVINWKYTGQGIRCLSGFDASNKKVLDWYALSGGQLKYYPLGTDALWKSKPFTLAEAPNQTGRDRLQSYFPDETKLLKDANLI